VLLVWRWVDLLAWADVGSWRGPRRSGAQVVVGALRSRPMQDAAVLGPVKAEP